MRTPPEDDLYREVLLDHYRHPRNRGRLAEKSATAHDANPLCGDDVTMDILVKGDKVADISFEGKGCAICLASASLLTERLKGKPVEDALALGRETVLEMLGVDRLTPVRVKCAMLPLKVAKLALYQHLARHRQAMERRG